MNIRHDWTTDAVEALYHLPLTELLFRAQTIHRRIHDPGTVQRCTLLSIKTGGCPEDCGYCPQSAHYDTGVERDGADGAGRRCWRPRGRRATAARRASAWARPGARCTTARRSTRCLTMVEDVAALGMEVCTTLGMLTAGQAQRLKSAGLTAYNHNLDTSPEFYPKIITTRTYQDRLDTLQHVQDAGLSVCCGGIVGMGESPRDRCAMLAQLGRLDPHPESLPVNVLVRTAGTPLADADDLDPIELVRTVACARLVAPRARVRLSAGRLALIGRSAGAVLHGGRELDLLRREAADLAESRRGRRSAADGAARSPFQA